MEEGEEVGINHFECSIDGSSFAAYTSPAQFDIQQTVLISRDHVEDNSEIRSISFVICGM
jgi:hypothetical protein